MANVTWKHTATVVGCVAGIIGLGAFAMPFLRSDPPPYANISRVDSVQMAIKSAKNEIRADLYFSRVFNLRTAQCNAINAGNRQLSITIAEQIAEAERVYMLLTGDVVSVRPCNEF